MKLREKDLKKFESYLKYEEKSRATCEKYMHDVRYFARYVGNREITKGEAISYKEDLKERYAPSSVNSMLVALNCFFKFIEKQDCCVKLIKLQRQIFCSEAKELSIEEYKRLIRAADDQETALMLQTICGTGIRVSELEYISVEAVRKGRATVNCKSKTRVIFIPIHVQEVLLPYIKKTGIKSGPVFASKSGKPLDRSCVWRKMKNLSEKAAVDAEKVFPHNLRHLFARTFYSMDGDIVRLADILGHSSINTTRIYTMETGRHHIDMLEKVQDVLATQ